MSIQSFQAQLKNEQRSNRAIDALRTFNQHKDARAALQAAENNGELAWNPWT
ncbi:MAG: hypothetical protein AAF772_14020 [Acidobacteriota bacterium]